MALPKQVEQDLKDIEEIENQLKAQDVPADDGLGESIEDTKVEEVKAEQVAEPPVEPVVEPVKDDFEQKYRTLRGKYDAEVPRLHSQVKELSGQIEALKATIEAKKATPEPEQQKSFVTEADKEAFGEEILDVQRRVAMEVGSKYEAHIAKLEQHIAQLEQRIDQTGNQVGEMTFEQNLVRLVPDFAQVNADPRWIEWLNEFDPIVRGPRRVMAQQAFESGDAEAVADYVKLFKQSITPKQESSKKSELEKQVAPSRNPTHTTAVQGKKTYTEAEANRIWAKVTDLNVKGMYDEATKLEAEISKAYVEGRVIGA